MKFAVVIKSQSHMARMMKSTILLNRLGLSVKDMFKNRHLMVKLWKFYLDVIYYHCFYTSVTTKKLCMFAVTQPSLLKSNTPNLFFVRIYEKL